MASIWPRVGAPDPRRRHPRRHQKPFPRSVKRLGGFLPRESARPTGEEQHIGLSQRAFAVAPGDFLDGHYAAAAAVDPPHGVQQEDEKSPQRDELKAPLGELVVAGRRLMRARTDCGCEPLRGRTDTSILLWSGLKRAR